MSHADAKTWARIISIENLSQDVRVIRFRAGDGSFSFEPGAHITFEIPIGNTVQTRSYSLIDMGDDSELLTIAVKRETEGRGGSIYMHSLQKDSELAVVGIGNSLRPAFNAEDYILIAGGIGITPLIGICRTLIKARKTVRMFYCVKSRKDILFLSDLTALLGEKLHIFCSQDNERLNVSQVIADTSSAAELYLCGPLRLTEEVKRAWAERRLPPQNLRYETFASSGSKPSKPFELWVEETGCKIEVPSDVTILDALLESGHDLMYECRKGECGLCKLTVLSHSSEIDHRDVFLSDAERLRADSICACVSRSYGGVLRVRLDNIQYGRSS